MELNDDVWLDLPPRDRWLEQVQNSLLTLGLLAEPALLDTELIPLVVPLLAAERREQESWDDTAVRVSDQVAAALQERMPQLVSSMLGPGPYGSSPPAGPPSAMLVEWSTVGAVLAAVADVQADPRRLPSPANADALLQDWSELLVDQRARDGRGLPTAAAVDTRLLIVTWGCLSDAVDIDSDSGVVEQPSAEVRRAIEWVGPVLAALDAYGGDDELDGVEAVLRSAVAAAVGEDTDDDVPYFGVESWRASPRSGQFEMELASNGETADQVAAAVAAVGAATVAVIPDTDERSGVVVLHVNPGTTIDHEPCVSTKLCPVCDEDLLRQLVRTQPVLLRFTRSDGSVAATAAQVDSFGDPHQAVAAARRVARLTHPPRT